MRTLRTLSGELVEIPDEVGERPRDVQKWWHSQLSDPLMWLSQIHIIPSNEDVYHVLIDPVKRVRMPRSFCDVEDIFGDLSSSTNESILSCILSQQGAFYRTRLLANPHPMVVEALLPHLDKLLLHNRWAIREAISSPDERVKVKVEHAIRYAGMNTHLMLLHSIPDPPYDFLHFTTSVDILEELFARPDAHAITFVWANMEWLVQQQKKDGTEFDLFARLPPNPHPAAVELVRRYLEQYELQYCPCGYACGDDEVLRRCLSICPDLVPLHQQAEAVAEYLLQPEVWNQVKAKTPRRFLRNPNNLVVNRIFEEIMANMVSLEFVCELAFNPHPRVVRWVINHLDSLTPVQIPLLWDKLSDMSVPTRCDRCTLPPEVMAKVMDMYSSAYTYHSSSSRDFLWVLESFLDQPDVVVEFV